MSRLTSSPRQHTYVGGPGRVEKLAPGVHDEGVIHRDHEDVTGILQIGMFEVAGDVLLRAAGAWWLVVSYLYAHI